MLSYNWDDQKTIVKIKEYLTAQGYSVWLDLEQMGGSTLEAMANAVEGSTVICVAMSEKYKNSGNCRLEGEYAQQQKKIIVPFMMQKNFRPTGWLGMLLGAKLYFDFSDTHEGEGFGKKLEELRGELTRHITPGTPQEGKKETTTTTTTTSKPPEHLDWNEEKTMAWIAKLGCKVDTFKPLDGLALDELVRLCVQDRSHKFISFLLHHVTNNLSSALKFSQALYKLKQ